MRPVASIAFAAVIAIPLPAFAYRPFDSTDVAVAEKGAFEVEAAPLSYRRDENGHTWIAPQLRLNYGFADNWEVVLEGQSEYAPHAAGRLEDNALSLKNVFREGTLQDKDGVSIAAEYTLLLPGIHEDNGVGAEITGIIGQQFSWGAVHVNVAAALTREQRGEVFFGTILEGPNAWVVRPVAEFVYERDTAGHEQTAFLAGAIWQVKDGLAFDAAVRRANTDGQTATEIRAGFTFDFSLR